MLMKLVLFGSKIFEVMKWWWKLVFWWLDDAVSKCRPQSGTWLFNLMSIFAINKWHIFHNMECAYIDLLQTNIFFCLGVHAFNDAVPRSWLRIHYDLHTSFQSFYQFIHQGHQITSVHKYLGKTVYTSLTSKFYVLVHKIIQMCYFQSDHCHQIEF